MCASWLVPRLPLVRSREGLCKGKAWALPCLTVWICLIRTGHFPLPHLVFLHSPPRLPCHGAGRAGGESLLYRGGNCGKTGTRPGSDYTSQPVLLPQQRAASWERPVPSGVRRACQVSPLQGLLSQIKKINVPRDSSKLLVISDESLFVFVFRFVWFSRLPE